MIDRIRIITIYCICDDFLKAQGTEHWPNIKITDPELMTIFILGHTDFYGNIEKARIFLQEHQYISRMLGKAVFVDAFIDLAEVNCMCCDKRFYFRIA